MYRLQCLFLKEKPYHEISAQKASDFIGSLLSVKFIFSEYEERGKLIFLHFKGKKFSVLIEKKDQHLFPDLRSLKGRELTVSGLVEEYQGRPQMFIFFPGQLSVLRTKTENGARLYKYGPLGDRTLHCNNVLLISKRNLCLAVSIGNNVLLISERDLSLARPERSMSCCLRRRLYLAIFIYYLTIGFMGI